MKELKRVPANKGIEKEYKRKLDKLVLAMSVSVLYWVLADYGGRTAWQMANAIRKRIKQWDKVFGEQSERIALWFVKSVKKQTETGMRMAFKGAGHNMRYGTPERVIKAITYENVELINSIPEKYFIGIKEVALLSLMYNWSKEKLKSELEKRRDITLRRIKNIASDQTHKTTELVKRGICENNNIWLGKWKYTWRSEHPRENHIQMDGLIFDIRTGALTPDGSELIFPAQKINCKCDFVPLIEEYGDDIRKEVEKNSYKARMDNPY